MQCLEIVAGHPGEHVVLEMPVHVPVEEFGQRVEGDGADRFTEIRIAALQPAMHRHPDQIAPQVGDERGTRNQQRQDRLANGKGTADDDSMEQQRDPRPGAGTAAMLIIASYSSSPHEL